MVAADGVCSIMKQRWVLSYKKMRLLQGSGARRLLKKALKPGSPARAVVAHAGVEQAIRYRMRESEVKSKSYCGLALTKLVFQQPARRGDQELNVLVVLEYGYAYLRKCSTHL